MHAKNAVLVLFIGLIILLSGCANLEKKLRTTCGNNECEWAEDAFSCFADCEGLSSCRVREQGPQFIEAGAEANLIVDLLHIDPSANPRIILAGCGAKGATLTNSKQVSDNMLIGTCSGYTQDGNYTIQHAAVETDETNGNFQILCRTSKPGKGTVEGGVDDDPGEDDQGEDNDDQGEDDNGDGNEQDENVSE